MQPENYTDPFADIHAVIDTADPDFDDWAAAVANDEPPAGTPRSLIPPTFTRRQLGDLPQPERLIAGTLDRRTVAAIAGPPGTLKSFITLSMLCSVATGTPWIGRLVETGPVLYVAAEGAFGIHSRITAWEQHHGTDVPDELLTVVAGPVNLLDHGQVAELAARASGCALVAFDTLARCTVGGDENSSRDMGIAVDSLYRVRDATGDGTVLTTHHTPKANGAIMRGSSALEGGLDTIYVTEGAAAAVTMTRKKRKDGPCDDVVTGFLQTVQGSGLFADTQRTLTNSADTLLSVFRGAFSDTGCTKAELRVAAGMAPQTFFTAVNSLVRLGILVNTGTEKRSFYVFGEGKQ